MELPDFIQVKEKMLCTSTKLYSVSQQILAQIMLTISDSFARKLSCVAK